MILASLYILSYILSMATYVLDGKTARIFAEVKNARVSGQTKSLEQEGENGDWDWAWGRVRLARFSRKSHSGNSRLCKTDYEKKKKKKKPQFYSLHK